MVWLFRDILHEPLVINIIGKTMENLVFRFSLTNQSIYPMIQ